MQTCAGIELGGTKIVCGLGTATGTLLERVEVPTRDPQHSLAEIRAVLDSFVESHGTFIGLGIGTFGPVRLDRNASDYGRITTTPKQDWRNCDIYGYFDDLLDVPIALDTDVAAAAFGEVTWGAAIDCSPAVYITIGTGIGAGILVDGIPIHGLLHPEIGHIRVPRAEGDEYAGSCPHHGDCLEGLTAGPSIIGRWGKRLDELPPEHPAYEQTVHYVSHLVANTILFVSPQRIVIGGGVMSGSDMFGRVRHGVQKILNQYLSVEAIDQFIDKLIVAPGLGINSGVLGAIAMAVALANSRVQ